MMRLGRYAILWMVVSYGVTAAAVTPWDAKLTDLAGKPAQLDTKGKAKAIFLFWGSWCPNCKAEIRSAFLSELAAKSGSAIFTINMDNDSKRAEHTVQKESIALPVMKDNDKALIKELKVFGVPHWAVYQKDKMGSFTLVDTAPGFDHDKITAALNK